MGDDEAVEGEGFEVASITVTRRLVDGPDSDQVWVNWSDGITMLEALGMLRMAEMTIVDDFNNPEEEN